MKMKTELHHKKMPQNKRSVSCKLSTAQISACGVLKVNYSDLLLSSGKIAKHISNLL